jgi:1-acyl-sn-glycerol-3-phosphate acyltransferase
MLSKAIYETLIRPITVILMKVIWIKKIDGLDNIPKIGPVILAANHSSYLDFLIIASIVKRRVTIIAAKELTKHPILGWYACNDGCILVDRKKLGVNYYRNCLKTLKSNKILLIFPEGTRSVTGSMQEWKQGFVELSIQTNTPIVPVAISGTYENLPKGGRLSFKKICTVTFGDPIYPPLKANIKDINIMLELSNNARKQVQKTLTSIKEGPLIKE